MAHAKAFQGFVPARKKGGAYNTGKGDAKTSNKMLN